MTITELKPIEADKLLALTEDEIANIQSRLAYQRQMRLLLQAVTQGYANLTLVERHMLERLGYASEYIGLTVVGAEKLQQHAETFGTSLKVKPAQDSIVIKEVEELTAEPPYVEYRILVPPAFPQYTETGLTATFMKWLGTFADDDVDVRGKLIGELVEADKRSRIIIVSLNKSASPAIRATVLQIWGDVPTLFVPVKV